MTDQYLKEDTKRLIRKVYHMVDKDECPSLESLNEGLNAMYGSEMLNKTQAARYLGIAVSTFNKYMSEGLIPKGVKKQNECIKWSVSSLRQARKRINMN